VSKAPNSPKEQPQQTPDAAELKSEHGKAFTR
jgi:hypothetical protein